MYCHISQPFCITSLYSKCKLTHWDSVSFYIASMSWSIFERLEVTTFALIALTSLSKLTTILLLDFFVNHSKMNQNTFFGKNHALRLTIFGSWFISKNCESLWNRIGEGRLRNLSRLDRVLESRWSAEVKKKSRRKKISFLSLLRIPEVGETTNMQSQITEKSTHLCHK